MRPECSSQRCRGPSSRSFETALLRLMPSFVPCADHINRAVPTGWPLEVDLASFGPGVTFGFELGLEFRFGLELGFGLEFGLGDGEIDHEAESVGKLPCR
jgi:hypothetical protein